MNEVEQRVVVAGLDQKRSRSAREIMALIGPELMLLIVVLLWASTFIVTKDAFDEMAPLSFIFVRFLLMALLAFGVLLVSARGDRSQFAIQRSDLPRFAIVGLTGYTLYQLGF